MKVLYHKNCNDGAGAALAVWMKHGDEGHEYIPCQYGEELPGGLEGEHVVMVDFSTKKEQTRELAQIAESILIIDHHQTAEAELEGVNDRKGCPIHTIFDMDKSGAVLAWEYFHRHPVPMLFQHIQDRDLWKFELDGTKDIGMALKLHPDWREWPELTLGELRIGGAAINTFLDIQSESIVKTKPITWDLTGDVVPVYNIPGFMLSDTLHKALGEYPDAPYAVGYFDLPDKRIYSLRSRKGSDIDVSAIAKLRGGGGHKHASGFPALLPAAWKDDDVQRLIDHCATQALDLRDEAEVVDRSVESWRSLPDHLQDLLNDAEKRLDTE